MPEDLVSRKSLDRKIRLRMMNAIQELNDASYDGDSYSGAAWEKVIDIWSEALDILEAEPNANPKFKEGEWLSVPWKLNAVKCNLCGNRSGIRTDFCCGCGAYMKGKIQRKE